jgi:hypothetical protein
MRIQINIGLYLLKLLPLMLLLLVSSKYAVSLHQQSLCAIVKNGLKMGPCTDPRMMMIMFGLFFDWVLSL